MYGQNLTKIQGRPINPNGGSSKDRPISKFCMPIRNLVADGFTWQLEQINLNIDML